jgi:hypothetical protein
MIDGLSAPLLTNVCGTRLQGGEMQETSKKNILKAVTTQDLLQEESENSKETLDDMMALT